jgi:hypothetical protein
MGSGKERLDDDDAAEIKKALATGADKETHFSASTLRF